MGGWTGTGNIDADPLFVDPVNGDFHLQPGSPCIDTGDPNSALDPDGTPADMGAYYFDHRPILSTDLFAGQIATIQVSNCTPDKKVYVAYSLTGGGPTWSPFGTLALSAPYYVFRPTKANSSGVAQIDKSIPKGAAGINVWMQAYDVKRKLLSNGLALTIL
jgi:hypothetical protein